MLKLSIILDFADHGLTEEEVILSNAASESKDAEQAIQRAAVVLKLKDGIGSLARILKTIEVSKDCESHTIFRTVES